MGNFRSDRGGFGRDRPSGRFGDRGRSGGFGRDRGFGGRDGGFNRGGFGGERRRPEMHDVICDNCKKECQVPFRPTGDKPVLCSDCFRKDGGASRSSERQGNSSSMSSEQFAQVNKKLDKILGILEQIEFEEEGEEGEEFSDEDEESEDGAKDEAPEGESAESEGEEETAA